MDELSKEYILLFQGISEAIEDIEEMAHRLKELQREAESVYVSRDEETSDDFWPAQSSSEHEQDRHKTYCVAT